MKLSEALKIAQRVVAELEPHCERIQIAGSIRRKKAEVGDIEIVCIPKEYEGEGFFATGIAAVCQQWVKIKGTLPCKYTQRMLPEGIKLDLFTATHINWGYILAIRTGSADFSKNVLAYGWTKRGYNGSDGNLMMQGHIIPVTEETRLFEIIGIPFISPEKRD